MHETFNAPLAESSKLLPIEHGNAAEVEPVEQNWLGAAAYSGLEAVRSHPLETGGTALLALLAIRFKTPILEEIAAAAAGAAKNATRSGSGVPFIRSSRGLADESSALADSTFVSPWARAGSSEAGAVVAKDGAGAVVAKGGAAANDAVVVAKETKSPVLPDALTDRIPDLSGMNFGRWAPKKLSRDSLAIPTISVDAFKIGIPHTQEAFKVVPRASAEANLYKNAKDATVRVWSKDGVGSGFFVDQNHIATANHVLNGRTGLVTVELASGKTVPARVVAREIDADYALLRIEDPMKFAKPLQFASAREVKTGMHGYLIGHPHGTVEKVMTKGRITDMGLFNGSPVATVKHSAESVRGMSGGPLLLENGKVLGLLRSGPANNGLAFHGEATHVRQMRPALDYVRKVENPNGIDWHTIADITKNSRNQPKIDITGRRDVG